MGSWHVLCPNCFALGQLPPAVAISESFLQKVPNTLSLIKASLPRKDEDRIAVLEARELQEFSCATIGAAESLAEARAGCIYLAVLLLSLICYEVVNNHGDGLQRLFSLSLGSCCTK